MAKLPDTLKWSKRKGVRKQFELSSGDEKLGTLVWQKTFGSLARAETPEGTWTFKRSGFIRPRVTVRLPDSDRDVAVYIPSWMGDGALQFETGERFTWNKQGFWKPIWSFVDESSGKPVITFSPLRGLFAKGTDVTIERAPRSKATGRLLVSLGWYLILLAEDDSAIAAAGAAST